MIELTLKCDGCGIIYELKDRTELPPSFYERELKKSNETWIQRS
jgi:hypothetical protein